MTLSTAEVGDRLHIHVMLGNKLTEVCEKVERVTKTLVITKTFRFGKETGRTSGGDSWGYQPSAKLFTDEELEKYKNRRVRRGILHYVTCVDTMDILKEKDDVFLINFLKTIYGNDPIDGLIARFRNV